MEVPVNDITLTKLEQDNFNSELSFLLETQTKKSFIFLFFLTYSIVDFVTVCDLESKSYSLVTRSAIGQLYRYDQ